MKVQIIPFQTDPKCLYHVSHKYLRFLEIKLKEFLRDINSDLKLNLSIICLSENEDSLQLGDCIKHRDKDIHITQQVILPNKHLYFEPEYVLKSKKFDFELSVKGYQTYPLDLFTKYSVEGILKYLSQNNLELPEGNASDVFVENTINESTKKADVFRYQNEELMQLDALISKTHWAYDDSEGKDWLDSEIGKKWIKLSEKYSFDSQGMLVLNSES